MVKRQKKIGCYTISQIQLGYFAIQMDEYTGKAVKKVQRTLLASNIYIIEKDRDIWIFDTGFSESLNIPYIHPRLKYSFSHVVSKYKHHHNVYICLTHCHPDHIGGLMEAFDEITELNWKVFVNKKNLDPTFYSQFQEVEEFINNKLLPYSNLFDLKHAEIIQPVFIGGHTPEHSILKLKGEEIYYPSDIIPTEYHITHEPIGEKNFDQNKFCEIRDKSIAEFREKKAMIMLSHAPNDGIIQL